MQRVAPVFGHALCYRSKSCTKATGPIAKKKVVIISLLRGKVQQKRLTLSLLSKYCRELHLQIFPTVDPLRHQTRASLQRRLFFCCLKSHKRNSIKGPPPSSKRPRLSPVTRFRKITLAFPYTGRVISLRKSELFYF